MIGGMSGGVEYSQEEGQFKLEKGKEDSKNYRAFGVDRLFFESFSI